MNEAYVNAGMDPIYDDPSKAGVGTNWQNEIYNENAPIMNHQASISGGGDKGSYFLSFGYLDQEGIVGGKDKSDYKRYSLRFNNTYNVFENKANKFFRSFKVGTNLGYTRIISKGISENDNFSGPLASAVMTPPNESVYLENHSRILRLRPLSPRIWLFGAKGIGSQLAICVIWSRLRNRGWSKR